eukprot:g42930.t1
MGLRFSIRDPELLMDELVLRRDVLFLEDWKRRPCHQTLTTWPEVTAQRLQECNSMLGTLKHTIVCLSVSIEGRRKKVTSGSRACGDWCAQSGTLAVKSRRQLGDGRAQRPDIKCYIGRGDIGEVEERCC